MVELALVLPAGRHGDLPPQARPRRRRRSRASSRARARRSAPAARLRVDYNQAYTADEAVRAIAAIAPFGIDCAEQPVRAERLAGDGARAARRLRAADGARGLLLAHRLHRAARARRGRRARRQHRAAGRHHRRRCARSTTPPRAASARSCTTSRSASPRRRRCTSARRAPSVLGHAMELFGHIMLEDDLIVEPLDYAGGRVRVPDGPGLGVALDEAALDRYATGARGGAGALSVDGMRRRRLYTGAEVVTLEPGAAARRGAGDRAATASSRVGSEADVPRGAARGRRRRGRARRPRRPLRAAGLHRHAPAPDRAALLRHERRPARRRRSIAALQETLRRAARGLPAGEWLVGLQLEDEALAERRLPSAAELDAACPDRPVVVLEHDGHSAVGNSARAGGGGHRRATRPIRPAAASSATRDGMPTGACFESAAQRLFGAVPAPSLERLRRRPRARRSRRLAACGITSAGVDPADRRGGAGRRDRPARVARHAAAARRGAASRPTRS